MDEWKDDNIFHWRCSEISVNMHRIALCWRLQLASISFDIPGTVLYAVTLETNNPKWLCRAELLPRLLSGAQTACSGLFFALQNQMRRVASFGLFPEQVTNHSSPPPPLVCFVSSFTMCETLSHCVFRSFWHRPQPTAVMSDTTRKSKFSPETYRQLCVLSLTPFLIWLQE